MTNEEIKNLADLARLELSEEDIESYKKDFEGILNYISTINSVHIDNFTEEVRGDTTNSMRNDDASYYSGEFSEILLEAAPQREGDFVKVDKIL